MCFTDSQKSVQTKTRIPVMIINIWIWIGPKSCAGCNILYTTLQSPKHIIKHTVRRLLLYLALTMPTMPEVRTSRCIATTTRERKVTGAPIDAGANGSAQSARKGPAYLTEWAASETSCHLKQTWHRVAWGQKYTSGVI